MARILRQRRGYNSCTKPFTESLKTLPTNWLHLARKPISGHRVWETLQASPPPQRCATSIDGPHAPAWGLGGDEGGGRCRRHFRTCFLEDYISRTSHKQSPLRELIQRSASNDARTPPLLPDADAADTITTESLCGATTGRWTLMVDESFVGQESLTGRKF
ncbi:hypothetical protein MMC32_004182 [Xylographa parallela]|nr:hypothetical protein [Xylographa parallela]